MLYCDLTLNRQNWRGHYQLSLPELTSLGIVGESGSGKSTLLRCLAGLESTCFGELKIAKKTLQSVHYFAPAEQRQLAFATQSSMLFPHMTVQKLLTLAASKGEVDPTTQTELMGRVGVLSWLHKKPAQLSGGQQQRVAFARTLLQSPALLLMDEPFSALDPINKRDMLEILKDYIETTPTQLIYVSHALEEVAYLCEHMSILADGKVLKTGPTATLMSDSSLSQAYSDLEFGAVVRCFAEQWNQDYQLMRLSIGQSDSCAQQLWMKMDKQLQGKPVFVKVPAQEVIVARRPIVDASIQNSLACQISGVEPGPNQNCLVKMDLDGQGIFAEISNRAQENLKLQQGERVYCHVKAMSLHAR
ncbi:ATP-binding cassette domain-containing protein [Echinimonas agarilytica]|uniref:ATP-binding cassette domain-containing protein n=1 Tax=Echinimonas agarilytica TaxID=1215918 RepID=A0AA41W8J0_9GAMM|nr:ATP-binding cassette domain-containing protein [Echinimonas agarilytica]MCM2680463.1 ATP-binding cassette domain-containing protein [Echinimonas agarilytica]